MRSDSSMSSWRPAALIWPDPPPAACTGDTTVRWMPSCESTSFTAATSGRSAEGPGPDRMPDPSITTGVPRIDAPEMVVSPSSFGVPSVEVTVSSVTTESMCTRPSTSTPDTELRAWTCKVEPLRVVSAVADDDPTVAMAGASAAGMVATALDPCSSARTRAFRPGAGLTSATGAPRLDVADTR